MNGRSARLLAHGRRSKSASEQRATLARLVKQLLLELEAPPTGPGRAPLKACRSTLDAGAELGVAKTDNKGWSPYGAPWLQPVARGGKSRSGGPGGITPKPLPSVATSCGLERW
jgi:hypothetical protein